MPICYYVPDALRGPKMFILGVTSEELMHTTGTAIGNFATIEDELSALRRHIIEYRTALNAEGIWLFLATLGCWSVSNIFLQFTGFGIAVLLFGERLTKRIGETRSFSKLVKAIEGRIAATLPEGDSTKARLYDLAELRSKELSMVNSLANTWAFLLCWLFYGASFAYVLFHLPVQ